LHFIPKINNAVEMLSSGDCPHSMITCGCWELHEKKKTPIEHTEYIPTAAEKF
jgi:hypothetical protein